MARSISRLVRQIVLASLPALGAGGAIGCGSDGNAGDSLDGGGDTTNCGMCGCGYNPARTQVVPYKRQCDAGAPPSDAVSDVEDAGDDAPADASTDATSGEDARDAASIDACGDPPSAVLDCFTQCPPGYTGGYGIVSTCKLLPFETGATPMVECTYVQPCGRRPARLGRVKHGATNGRDAIAHHLAEAAFLEAASVDAFEILATELAHHGAPASLVRRAQRAARDEVRHARVMRTLAARHDATPATPRVAKAKTRSLETLARENAIEGCVRETYGAAMAAWQGELARDRATRLAMRAIARDEAMHADLAWSVARWASRRLSAAARARVARARTRAVTTLRAEVAAPIDPQLVRSLGVPDRVGALAMIDRLERELWG